MREDNKDIAAIADELNVSTEVVERQIENKDRIKFACSAPNRFIERLRPIQQQFAAVSRPGGLPADKAFFDALSGEP